MKIRLLQYSSLLLLLCWGSFGTFAQADWVQIGLDIDGESAGDRFGSSVSINAEGNIVASGATENSSLGVVNGGHVRVFENIAETWVQVGGDINALVSGDEFGYSVSLNEAGTIVAVGAPASDVAGVDAGQVRVFEFSGGAWLQIGAAINGEAAGDQSGYSVSLNGDGTILAIGAIHNDGIGADAGHVRVFQYSGGAWIQLGADIDGEFALDWSGSSVSLNSAGDRVSIGAFKNDGAGTFSGHVRVFAFSGGSWSQLGGDINGVNAGDECGRSTSLSSDGNRVIVGAPKFDGVGIDAGHARVFQYSGGSWTQLGADLNGSTPGDEYGWTCAISKVGNTAVLGGPKNYSFGAEAGQIKAFQLIFGVWMQKGTNRNGENLYDRWGWCSTVNAEGDILAGGAYVNDGAGTSAGHVRVYRFICDSLDVTISDLEVCFGDPVTLDAVSVIGSTITWDMGVINGVPFIPASTGVFTYNAFADSPNDCNYSVDILVHELPIVTAAVDPDEICIGESAIFTGTGANSYSWDGGVMDGVSFIPIFAGTTTYTVTGTDLNGCENTASVDLIVNDLPVVIASASPTEICLGESITLTGSGADTYVWDGGITDGIAFTPLLAGTFTYNLTGTNTTTGCENTATIDITVNDTPTVIATATPIELCLGESLIFTGTGADSYTWDLGVTDGISFTPAAAGTFTHTVTGTITATGCQAVSTIDITVYDIPTVTASVDPTEICIGESVIFSGGGAISYVWDGGVTDGVSFTPATAGTFTFNVIGTSAIGCENTASVDLIVNDLPVVIASASPTEICLGESITLTGSGADTYVWDGGITDGIAFTPLLAGTFTYNLTGTNTTTGCENTATIDITVNDTPTVIATATPIELCLGESLIFTGTGADSYTWDLGVTDGISFTPAAAGTFTHTVTGTITATGCQAVNTIDITVYDIPTVTASVDPTEICIGESAIFSGGGAITYVWDGGVTDGVSFTPATAGTFTFNVIGTSAIGCENTASVDLIVNDLPVVIATASPTEICLGESITLTGSGADTYVWDGGITDGIAFTPLIAESRTYNVIGTDLTTGCQNTSSVTITTYPNPIVTATASSTEICFGESITFTGSGADSYLWDAGIVNGMPYFPTSTGTFTYAVIGYLGPLACESATNITITVHELPDVTATVEPDEICLGESVLFTGSGAESYTWDGDVEDNVPFTPTETGITTYTVTGYSSWGCEKSVSVDILVHELPDLTANLDTIINTGGTALLAAYSSHSGDYYWSPDDDVTCETCPITTANTLENTTYSVEFTDENGCTAQAEVLVLVNFIKGIGVPTAFSPNGDGNNDVLFVKGYTIVQMHFEVYNRYGERVFQSSDQGIGWDGTYHNMEENPGVFTWILYYTLTDGDRGNLHGNTTLVR